MWDVPILISAFSLVVSAGAVFLSLYRDVLLTPKLHHSVEELRESSGESLERSFKNPELAGDIPLRYAVKVQIRSIGWATATDVEMRVAAEQGLIVHARTDREELAEQLADLRREAAREVYITIRRMVPGERVTFWFWYDVPGSSRELKPPLPLVWVRHGAGLSQAER